MKLNNVGKPVWIRRITSYKEGSTVYSGATAGFFAEFHQVVKTPNGYAAIGAAQVNPIGGTPGWRMLLCEYDENGTLLNPQTAFALTGADITQGEAITMNPAQNEFIVGGVVQATATVGRKAFLSRINYASRSVSANQVLGGNFLASPGYPAQAGGNNIFKILTRPSGSTYEIFACGWKSVSGDNERKTVVNSNGASTVLWKRDKDMWLIKANAALSTAPAEYTYNKTSVVYPTSLYYTETGPLSARDMATSMSSAGYCTSCIPNKFLDATAHLKASENKDERAYDMTLTADGNIAIIGLVNEVAVYGYLDGNGPDPSIADFIRDGNGLIATTGGYFYDEYLDGDAYMIKINPANGAKLWAKNVSHFSSKDFYPQIYQKNSGNYVIAGSTADQAFNNDPEFAYDALLLETTDNGTAGHVWRRTYNTHDHHADHTLSTYNMCLFSLEQTADGGFVIGGDGTITDPTDINKYDDLFSIGKFSPFGNIGVPFDFTAANNNIFPAGVSTVTWTGVSYKIGARITVPAGKTLNIANSTISFAGSDQMKDFRDFDPAGTGDLIGIEVMPGGRLTVTNSTLQGMTNTYDGRYMWDGIVIGGNPTAAQTYAAQGRITISGSVIKDAHMGISVTTASRNNVQFADNTTSPSYSLLTSASRYRLRGDGGGGIVNASGTTFQNCAFGANHQRYPTPGLGLGAGMGSTYQSCTFTCDALGLVDECFYANANGGPKPTAEHFGDWAVDNIRLYDNTFFCDPSFPIDLRSRGINAVDGGLRILRYCSFTDQYGTCYGPGPGNSFTNLNQAITASYTPGMGSTPLVITNNTFENNRRGVSVSGSMNALTLAHNQINVPPYLLQDPGTKGAYLLGCTGYAVYDNQFNKVASASGSGVFGLMVNTGSNAYDNDVRLNAFNNLSYGAVAAQLNGGADRGLQYRCNDFQNGMYRDISRLSAFDFNTPVSATMRQIQGTCATSSSPGGNRFYNACTNAAVYKHLHADMYVGQQVVYNANAASTVYDPKNDPYAGNCVQNKWTVNNCFLSAPDYSIACPSVQEGSLGNSSKKALVATWDAMLDTMSSSNPAYQDLRWERDVAVSGLCRWHGSNGYPDSAARLLDKYSRWSESLPYWIQSGNFTKARAAWASLATATQDEQDYAWLGNKAINLFSAGSGWAALDSAQRDTVSVISRNYAFSGYLAQGITSLLGVSSFRWPEPDTLVGGGYRQGPGIQDEEQQAGVPGLSVYPNPTTGLLTITSSKAGMLQLSSIDGRQLAAFQINEGSMSITIPAGTPSGIYIGRIAFTDGSQQVIRILYQP